jgi:NAD(P)-dependent dehydrogenase (short-subunit alcohol dehydrogenase family)
MQLAGKVVVVTGSTRGIGRAIAEACSGEGAAVVVSSRTEAAVAAAVASLQKQGRRVSGIACDVARSGDLDGLLRHALETWGKVDAWVNNAGLSSGMRPIQELAPEEISRIVEVNVTGAMLGCRLAIPYFLEHPGVLVNLSGKGGRGESSGFTAVYAATKAAVTSLTRSLAAENLGRKISIHAAIPGMVATDFFRDAKNSPSMAQSIASLPYVLDAIGVPLAVVGRFFVPILAQEPGRVTGEVYNVLAGPRLWRGIAKLMWYRAQGKIPASAR